MKPRVSMKKPNVTILVRYGVVEAVYASSPVEIEVIDFDDAAQEGDLSASLPDTARSLGVAGQVLVWER